MRDWEAAEFGAGRMVPWLAVAYGFGDVVYFSAERERRWRPLAWRSQSWHAGAASAFRWRRLSPRLPSASPAQRWHTAWIAHPVLRHPAWGIAITGFVEAREEREHNDRIVVRTRTMEGRGLDPALASVRVVLRPGTAPPVGSFVTFKADLLPPLPPLRPGGYDFARDMYFSALGASGFVLGGIKTAAPPAASGGAWLRYTAVVETMRDGIDQRIRTVIPGDEGAIASAVITGKRGEVSPAVKDAFYVSSLVHVLAIAGFHMAVVTGIIFFFVRGGLALIPSLASRRPIKKWAAAIALLGAAFYLVLSGAGTATQRAFVMVAIVPTGVMVDRPTLTFRALSIAAFGVPHFGAAGCIDAELPAVVCGNARFDRRLSLWAVVAACRDRIRLARPPGAVGLARGRDNRLYLGGRRARHLPLRRLQLPSRGTLRRAGQCAGDAGGLRLGHAHGHSWRAAPAARLRWRVLAVDGRRHQLDYRRRAVGGASAGRGRGYFRLRHRAAAALYRGLAADVSLAHAITAERRAAHACRRSLGADDATAGFAGVGRRPERGVARG